MDTECGVDERSEVNFIYTNKPYVLPHKDNLINKIKFNTHNQTMWIDNDNNVCCERKKIKIDDSSHNPSTRSFHQIFSLHLLLLCHKNQYYLHSIFCFGVFFSLFPLTKYKLMFIYLLKLLITSHVFHFHWILSEEKKIRKM